MTKAIIAAQIEKNGGWRTSYNNVFDVQKAVDQLEQWALELTWELKRPIKSKDYPTAEIMTIGTIAYINSFDDFRNGQGLNPE